MKKQKNPKIRNAICPLPWISASFNTDSSLRVCCNTNHGGSIKNENNKIYLSQINQDSDIQNSETIRTLKSKMLEGERSDFCSSCYKSEDASGISIRQYYLKKYSDVIERVIDSNQLDHVEKIQFLDFSLSNNCNLKCRMCTPGASFLLADDFNKLEIPFDSEYSRNAHTLWKYDGLVENLISQKGNALSDILFTGGEPLTNQVHLKILNDLVISNKASKIKLTYHTNLMVLPDSVLDFWKHFEQIDLHLSLEGHEKYNDYIRHNSSWEKISRNIEKLFSHKEEFSLWFEIHTVFQAYNIQFITEYLDFLKKYDSIFPTVPHFIWLDNPSFLSANSLSESIKHQAIKDISSFLISNERFYKNSKFRDFNFEKIQILKSCLNRIDFFDHEGERNRFIDYTVKLDKLRNQSVLEAIPQLKEMFINI